MYQFSDSDSVDSDEGIRYKTESIRNKKPNDKSKERKKESYRHRERNRSRSRSRSRHHTERRKLKKQKKDYSPEDKSNRKSSRSRHRESDTSNDKKRRKEKIKDKKEESIPYKKDTVLLPVEEKPTEEHSNVITSEEFGPSLPKTESTNNDKEQPALKPVEDDSQNLPIGPILPSETSTPTKSENGDEEQSQNGNTFGPQLPPHLLKPVAEDNLIGPVLPPHFVTVSSLDDDSSDTQDNGESSNQNNVIGPTLPPRLLKNEEENVIGPALPPHLQQQSPGKEEDESEDVYGPVPAGAQFSQAHIELEERALKMKMDQLDSSENKQPVREEWMLTLPEAKAASFGLGPRQFRRKAGPDLSDRSSWTDTPEDKAKKKQGKIEPVIDLKKEAELKHIHSRNLEQEKIAKEHKKEKDSLLEIHRKKLKNEKNESGPSERRPFSREIDLQVNRFDEAQKKAVLKKAQLLDNRFSSGESKFL
ncbi:GPALPP motifs-containing protein 1 [Anoplophora glabripennis]|uniref:GPALPP motifs-containing protein 1 n=1 Tax=Anoplophora glabripennis TaxID=217634 RepID=UPI000875208C|nr:GPALPP motifs-containing protein 1 [Anoplophora glabripennis]XP_018561354.1 GPALPP motifs-containing protein 1 [Anoplophora glabripennis]